MCGRKKSYATVLKLSIICLLWADCYDHAVLTKMTGGKRCDCGGAMHCASLFLNECLTMGRRVGAF